MSSVGDFVQALSAGVGAAVSTTALYPIDLIKTSLQAGLPDGRKFRGSSEVVQHVVRTRGVTGLYRGMGSKVAEQVIRDVLFFYNFSLVRRALAGAGPMSTAVNLLVGYLSGVGTTAVISPLEIASTRLQTSEDAAGGSLLSTLRDIVREGGLPALYRFAPPSRPGRRPADGPHACRAGIAVRRPQGLPRVAGAVREPRHPVHHL